MPAVVLLFATAVFAYALDAILVGSLIGAIRLPLRNHLSNRGLFLGLLLVFAFLDLYWIPAVLALDPSFKIGNPGAAAVFGEEFPATEILGFGWFDVVVWGVQSSVAVWVANRLSRRMDGVT